MSPHITRNKLLAAARRMGLDVTISPVVGGVHYDILAPIGQHFDDGLHCIQWYEYDEDKEGWKASGYADELETLGTILDCTPDCDCGFGQPTADAVIQPPTYTEETAS